MSKLHLCRPLRELVQLVSFIALMITTCGVYAAVPEIVFKAMPEGEIQAKMLSDNQDRVHLLYFKLQPETFEGHLFYRQYQANERQWSTPIQVSDRIFPLPYIVAAASVAVDDSGRVHVVWLRGQEDGYAYSRSNTQGTEFEPEQTLNIVNKEFIEPGASIATHENQITITWASGEDEESRAIYTLNSEDGGQSFANERLVGQKKLGACACCAHATSYTSEGKLIIAYRSAVNGSGRHIQLLTVPENPNNSQTQLIAKWNYDACPVSTNSIGRDRKLQNWLVFENDAKVYSVSLQDKSLSLQPLPQPENDTRQKHPSIAFNGTGYKLVVWSEGIDFSGGGEVKYQLFDPKGKIVTIPATDVMEIARSSFTAVSALPDGSFVVFY